MLDFLLVGAGLTNAVIAHELTKAGFNIKVIEKRENLAGNCYTEEINGIEVHKHGPHIFHTSSQVVWEWANQFSDFVHYKHKVIARHRNKFYSFPINLLTLQQVWPNLKEKSEFIAKIAEETDLYRQVYTPDSKYRRKDNLEQWCLEMIGPTLYSIFIKGYTEKQWGRSSTELPSGLIKRIPIRFSFNDNYYPENRSHWQGIPRVGYTDWIKNMFNGSTVLLSTDFFRHRFHWEKRARNIIYSGPIDRFFNYKYGGLENISLDFSHQYFVENSLQGVAQINYTSAKIPFTRTVEHKFFRPDKKSKGTVVTIETPIPISTIHDEPYYPLNTQMNKRKLNNYRKLKPNNVFLVGRLGTYKYLDMDQAISAALFTAQRIIEDDKRNDKRN